MPSPAPGDATLTIDRLGARDLVGKGGFRMTSAAFEDGQMLDPCFTAQEEDAVAPPLEWNAPPPGAQELVLVAECMETGACHWLVWGLAPQQGKLMEGEVPPRVGKNQAGNSEWLLPNPKEGDPQHTYAFQLFAVDLPLVNMPGAGLDEVAKSMEDHVVSVATLDAVYQFTEEEDWDDVDLDEIDFDGS
jgi:phosphatidylethanolamine-binding protein (PEBP) family uncharacterized protein